MREFRQARWPEPLIFNLPKEAKVGIKLGDEFENIGKEALKSVKNSVTRSSERLGLPDLSEVEVVRHYTRLTQMAYGVDLGPVPLGSCTMKYNPKICEELATDRRVTDLHPYQDEETVQGLLELIYLLQKWLAEITGTCICTIHPPAGASGEFVGALIIKKYLMDRGYVNKDEMIIPDSAHGSNPASAVMAGFKVVKVPTDPEGNTDINALRSVVSERTAGIMLTNPNTLGLFEEHILSIAELIHGVGGLLYYDGANLNGIIGIARPGDMGFDVIHLNLHKTFATPHGGGGPGAGVICVKEELKDYIPVPVVDYDGRKYYLRYDVPKTIGRVSWFYGNIIPAVKSFIYLAALGPEVREVAEVSVLNTNYLLRKLRGLKGISLVYGEDRWRKHELVISFESLVKETGVSAEDVAKALLDRGIHAPTIYFPLIVPEAHMIELTESESLESIEAIFEAYRDVIEEAYRNPEKVKGTPRNVAVSRLDPMIANHPKTLTLTYKAGKKLGYWG